MPRAEENENAAALGADMRLEALFGVRGKVALVTGGGSGIGAMVTAGLVRNGALVYVASRKDTSGFTKELGGQCFPVQCDIAVQADVERLAERIEREHGRLDILINNAGTNYNAPLGKYTEQGFDKTMAVNVRALFMTTQTFLPLLEKAGTKESPARVVNISSINGLRAPVGFDTFAYSASKAAVLMLTQHMSGKLAKRNILMNSICPGPFESRMMRGSIRAAKGAIEASTALGRLGAPEDVAAAVLYLCGKGGSFVLGTQWAVDGGVLVTSPSRL